MLEGDSPALLHLRDVKVNTFRLAFLLLLKPLLVLLVGIALGDCSLLPRLVVVLVLLVDDYRLVYRQQLNLCRSQTPVVVPHRHSDKTEAEVTRHQEPLSGFPVS